MAAYIQFLRDGAAVPLCKVDEEICNMLHVDVHERNWVHGWFDTVGLMLALGKSFAEVREIFEGDETFQQIIAYLEDNFQVDAWAGR